MAVIETILGSLAGAGMGVANNFLTGARTEEDRWLNYNLNERAAINADKKTRALYHDIYSPQALAKQYEEAGLSPAMMFGGTPGQGGMSGAQGSGAGGLQTPYIPISALEGAQIANLAAQTQKTQAETANIREDTNILEIQKEVQEMQKNQYKTEFTLLNAGYQMEDGTTKSYFDIAGESDNFDQFIGKCREAALKAGNQNIIQDLASEQGLRVMRGIFMARKEMNTNIAILSESEVSSQFQLSIVKAMQATDFAEKNAESAVAYLKANIETAELTETQKEAWNNLISKFGEKGSTTRDILVVLGMLVNNAATNWGMPNITTHNKTVQIFK